MLSNTRASIKPSEEVKYKNESQILTTDATIPTSKFSLKLLTNGQFIVSQKETPWTKSLIINTDIKEILRYSVNKKVITLTY